jgi:DNA-binding MarR family transcriptional regulator
VKLGQVARRWRALIDTRLKVFGLTDATWRPLLHLSKLPAPPRQTDLADSLGIEGPSLVRLLDTLERDGYIVRCADSDRRTKTIRQVGERAARHQCLCWAANCFCWSGVDSFWYFAFHSS